MSVWKRKKLNPYLIPYTKISSKNIEDLNIRPETKISGRNHRGKYFDIGLGNSFFMSPNVQSTEGKLDKRDYVKLKHFCKAKETIKRLKINVQNGKNIFKSCIW